MLQYIGFFLVFMFLPFFVVLSRSHWTPHGFMTLKKRVTWRLKTKKVLLPEGKYHFLLPFCWIVTDGSNRIVDIPVSTTVSVAMIQKEYTTSDRMIIVVNISAQYTVCEPQKFLADIINKDGAIIESQGINEHVLTIIDEECKKCISNMSIQGAKNLLATLSDIEKQITTSLSHRKKRDYIEFKTLTVKNVRIQVDPSNPDEMGGLMNHWCNLNQSQMATNELEHIKKIISCVIADGKGSNISLTLNCGGFRYSCDSISTQLILNNASVKG